MQHPRLTPGLYLVATPIGTAGDITLRALDILANADVIAAEDTRQTRKLLAIHGVRLNDRPLLPYHDHNGAAQRPRLLAMVQGGKSLAYVSDAGTPLLADPGYKLAEAMIAENLAVTAAPGASALLAALSVAGLPTDRFLFAGFLPPKQAARRKELAELATIGATLVFYESPKRLASCLADMADRLGSRQIAVCRELTKKFEQVRRGDLAGLAAEYAGQTPKGEIVVVVGPPNRPEPDLENMDKFIGLTLRDNGVKDTAKLVAERYGISRKLAYERSLALNKKPT